MNNFAQNNFTIAGSKIKVANVLNTIKRAKNVPTVTYGVKVDVISGKNPKEMTMAFPIIALYGSPHIKALAASISLSSL